MEGRRIRPRPSDKRSGRTSARSLQAKGDPHYAAQTNKVLAQIGKEGRGATKEVDPTITVTIPLRAASTITLEEGDDTAIVFYHAHGYRVRLVLNDDPVLFKKLADLITSARRSLGVEAAVAEVIAARAKPPIKKVTPTRPKVVGTHGGPDIEQARKRLAKGKK